MKRDILAEIYMHPGIHFRGIVRKTGLSIPAVKNQADKLLENHLVSKIHEGRNVKFYINFKNRNIIPRIYKIEYERLNMLPKKVKDVLFDFVNLLEEKPLLTIVFGSYAKGSYTNRSDVDILLVMNKVDKREIEAKTRIVSGRYSIRLEPVYLSWKEFRSKFFDESDAFMKEIKLNKIIVTGVEYWVGLENEKA